ncbi:MAG: hypothetical protein K6A23_08775 [Butyrivibrio sp.]|nr:hypothetical protein [Butyrivibrio sp.]
MKAVVLEIRNGKAAVLTEKGEVITVRQKCSVGDTIQIRSINMTRIVKYTIPAVAAMIMVTFGSVFYYNTAMAYSYVTVEGDSNIQLTLNRKNEVIAIEALDEDSRTLVDELLENGIEKASLEDAMDKISQTVSSEKQQKSSEDSDDNTAYTTEAYLTYTVKSSDEKTEKELSDRISEKEATDQNVEKQSEMIKEKEETNQEDTENTNIQPANETNIIPDGKETNPTEENRNNTDLQNGENPAKVSENNNNNTANNADKNTESNNTENRNTSSIDNGTGNSTDNNSDSIGETPPAVTEESGNMAPPAAGSYTKPAFYENKGTENNQNTGIPESTNNENSIGTDKNMNNKEDAGNSSDNTAEGNN